MGLIGPGWIDYICPSRGVGQHFAGQLFTSRSAELARCLTRLPDISTDEPHHSTVPPSSETLRLFYRIRATGREGSVFTSLNWGVGTMALP